MGCGRKGEEVGMWERSEGVGEKERARNTKRKAQREGPQKKNEKCNHEEKHTMDEEQHGTKADSSRTNEGPRARHGKHILARFFDSNTVSLKTSMWKSSEITSYV
jgi:hypothetical protein